ncbi:MAG: kefC [Cyanobacteria bacterium RYN_339]|nr:kefC [Cyanobacteria bacterium RYN_339]
MNNHVILCGLGELGFRTLERLRAFGDEVSVLDPNPPAAFRARLEEWKVPLVVDEGRNPRGLRAAGILTARAVIATTGDDLTNLSIALAAREENPDVQLVVRLFNPRMVEKVQREIKHCRVLDVAALAAPVFAYAGLHDDVLHVIDVPGGRYLLRRWRETPPAEASLLAVRRLPRDVFGGAGAGGLGFSLAARPTWDTLPVDNVAFAPGDEAYGLVPADQGEDDPLALVPRGTRNRARALQRKLAAVSENSFAAVMLITVLLGAVSVELFRQSLGLSFVQSLYYVVTVMTTTGFGDISVKDSNPAMILYVTALMAVGSLLMAALYAFVTEALLAVRLGQFFDRRPMPQRGHFILAGLGTVGFRIAEEVQRLGHPCVALEKSDNSRLIERARRLGVKVVVSQDVFGAMADVNLEEARCVMTVTDDDALNLELALMAQERNPRGRVVVRFFDPHMAGLLERTFGIHLARSPSAIAAPAFAVAAASEDLMDAFDLADEVWCVGRVTVAGDGGLAGRTVGSLASASILPLALRQAGGEWSTRCPTGHALKDGDELIVVTPYETWLQLHRG